MDISDKEIQELISNPYENLNVEIKTWIDPASNEGIAKIVKACLALYNRNGGFLIIGFKDKIFKADPLPSNLTDVRKSFNQDIIQGIISKYSSYIFEVCVGFGTRDDQEFPIIKIDSGVKFSAVTKSELTDPNNPKKPFISKDKVYFRTLNSNGTPSSSEAKANDWSEIIQICFDNKEADLGRFLRKHLNDLQLSSLASILTPVVGSDRHKTLEQETIEFMNSCKVSFKEELQNRHLTEQQTEWLNGLSLEISVVTDNPRNTECATQEFLNTVLSANLNLTGWPIWLDTRSFNDPLARPKVINNSWQSLIVSTDGGWSKHIDFMQFDPQGRIYLNRLMQEDFQDNITPRTILDPILMIYRTAESIAVGLKIFKKLGWAEESNLGFYFRWCSLNNRQLACWANPFTDVLPGYASYSDKVTSFVEIPLDTPISAIAPFVEIALKKLFVAFGGHTINSKVYEERVTMLLEKRI